MSDRKGGELMTYRDGAYANIMMDIDSLFPFDYHPIYMEHSPDLRRIARPRRGFAPVRYYFIDYDLSSYIAPGEPRLVFGEDGRDQDVPELSDSIPYDPFKVDIFITGNLFLAELINVSRCAYSLLRLTRIRRSTLTSGFSCP